MMSGETNNSTSLRRENSWSMVASSNGTAAAATPSLSRSHSTSSSSQPPTPFVHLSRDNSVSSSVSSSSDLSLLNPTRETSFVVVDSNNSPTTPPLSSSASTSSSVPRGPSVTSWAAAVKRTLPAARSQNNGGSRPNDFRVIDDHYPSATASSAGPSSLSSVTSADTTADLLPCGCARSIVGGVELRGLQLRHTCPLDAPTNQQAARAGLYKYHPEHVVPDFARIPSTDDLYSSEYDHDTDGRDHALDLLEGSTRERVSLAHKSSSSASASAAQAHRKSRKQLRMESADWLKSLREHVSEHQKHLETVLDSHRRALQQQAEWIQTTSSQKRSNRFAASKHIENDSQTTASASSSSSTSASDATATDHGMIMAYPSPCRWGDFQSDFLQHFLPLVLCQFDNVKLGTEIVSISRIEPEKPAGQPYFGCFNMAHFNHAHGFVDQNRKAPHTSLKVKPTVYLELGCARTLRGAVLRNRYGDGLHITQPQGTAGHTPAVCAEVCQGAYNAVLGAGSQYEEHGTELTEVYKLFAKLPAHSEEVHIAYVCAQVLDHDKQRFNWQWIHSERTPYSRFSRPRAQPSYKWSGEFSCGTSRGVTTMLEINFTLKDPKKNKPPSSQ